MHVRALTWVLVPCALAMLWWLALRTPETLQPAPASDTGATAATAATPTQSHADRPSAPAQPTAAPPSPRAPSLVAQPVAETTNLSSAATSTLGASKLPPQAPDSRGYVTAFEKVFNAAPRDSAASDAESYVQKLFRGADMPDGVLRSVLCRQGICKLELHWVLAHDAAYRRATDELIDGNAKNLATRAQEPDAQGEVRVDAFWRRPKDLP
jgi:hypothetical protein